MTLNQLIAELVEIREKCGGDLIVIVDNSEDPEPLVIFDPPHDMRVWIY